MFCNFADDRVRLCRNWGLCIRNGAMEHMNFPDLGIIVETAVIGGVILWRMRKNNKK